MLKHAGASDRAIARAAGVSPMTVHRIRRPPCQAVPARIGAELAGRLLAVTPEAAQQAALRRDACGSRHRLRALIALGHPGASLARHLGAPSAVVWNLARGRTATVSIELQTAICGLYGQLWNQQPPERTAAGRRSAAAARAKAAERGWPPPMGLDDDRIDDPAYRPRSRWLPASGTNATPAPPAPALVQLLARQQGHDQHGRSSRHSPADAARREARHER
jgi:hypothetical protein